MSAFLECKMKQLLLYTLTVDWPIQGPFRQCTVNMQTTNDSVVHMKKFTFIDFYVGTQPADELHHAPLQYNHIQLNWVHQQDCRRGGRSKYYLLSLGCADR